MYVIFVYTELIFLFVKCMLEIISLYHCKTSLTLSFWEKLSLVC